MRMRARSSALAAVLLCLGACSADRENPPIFVFGADGLEWSVMQPLLEAGRLPNFQKLIDRGMAGFLETDKPTFSPVLWTSIATGKTPDMHGIFNFAELDERNQPVGLPYTSECRRVPAIWNIAADAGRSVLSVAWWVSWPAEVLERGRVFSSYAAQVQAKILWKPTVWEPGLLAELTSPPSLELEAEDALRAGIAGGSVEQEFTEIFGSFDPQWELLKDRENVFSIAYRGDATHVRIMREQLDVEVADLNLVYVGLPDVAGHFFWRYYEPDAYPYDVDPEQVAAAGAHIDLAYEVTDRWLGELLDELPGDARIMVISDHGMHAGNKSDPETPQSGTHRDAPPGVIIVAGPGIQATGFQADGSLGRIYDVAPTLLAWMGLEQDASMSGYPMNDLMTQEWREAHPAVYRDQPYSEGFREPKPPREPMQDASAAFKEGILDQLGYTGEMEESG